MSEFTEADFTEEEIEALRYMYHYVRRSVYSTLEIDNGAYSLLKLKELIGTRKACSGPYYYITNKGRDIARELGL